MPLCVVVVCVLAVSAGLVAGEIYHIPTVSMATPDNSSCPSDTDLDAVKRIVSKTISNVISKEFACAGPGWKRVAYLNMRDPNQTCPTAWRLYEQDSIRACGRKEGGSSCDSVYFSTGGYVYSQVCGRVTGYQYASPDATAHISHIPEEIINGPYLDGVSVTYGMPRMHIWSLYGSTDSSRCCGNHVDIVASLSFIGNNTFCDTGNPYNSPWEHSLFTEHPLWDGITKCPRSPTCCAPHSGPWFHTTLPHLTIDDIEVRICGDQHTGDEDTPVELIEIYIK